MVRDDEGLDLRLLPAVVGAWLGAWLAPTLPLLMVAIVVVALIVACFGLRRRPTALVAAAIPAAVLAGMALRLFTLDHGPVPDLAEGHRSVVIDGTLTSDPHVVTRPGFGGVTQQQVRVDLRVEHVAAGDEQWNTRAPVLVLAEAEGWEELTFGDHVRVQGTLQPADGVDPLSALLFGRGPPQPTGSAGALLRGAEHMREGLRQAMSGTAADAQGLLPGLVVGDTSQLSTELEDDLRSSGLTHLTAVSGANVAIVLVAVVALARLLGARGYAVPVVGLTAVAWFVLLARPQPSVLRAAVMGALGVIAVISVGHRRNPTLLLSAVVLLLLIDPWLARSWGFALSAAATAGLVILAGRWRDRLARRWPQPLADGAAVALAAQLATLPLVVALAGSVPLLSVPANVLAAPAVAPATVLGAAAAAMSPIAPWGAQVLAWCGQWPALWIAEVAHRTAAAPWATVAWPDGWTGSVLVLSLIGLGVGLGRLLRGRRWWSRRIRWLVFVVVVVLVVAFVRGPARWPPPGWLLVACDVGQGDALVVPTEPGSALVVDTGPEPRSVDRCLDRLGVDRVDLIVLTHFHADHVAGLSGVRADRPVGTVMISPLADPADQAQQVNEETTDTPVVVAQPGQEGELGSVHWQVVWPQRLIAGEGSAANNASVVLRIEIRGVSMLLTGDIEPPAQRALATSGVDISTDVLKVPHHGSRYQDPTFWQAVSPRVAVVSAGVDNTYGHPDPGLLRSLGEAGVLVGRTDQDGSLAIVVEEGRLRLVDEP